MNWHEIVAKAVEIAANTLKATYYVLKLLQYVLETCGK